MQILNYYEQKNFIDDYRKLESDTTLQNLIAQADARYILYITGEARENYPRFTINDTQLNLLAFQYLNIGYYFFINEEYNDAVKALEKGASILEHTHGGINIETINKHLYCLISALAYYVSFQYSKAFILISKLENNTKISLLISLFLKKTLMY